MKLVFYDGDLSDINVANMIEQGLMDKVSLDRRNRVFIDARDGISSVLKNFEFIYNNCNNSDSFTIYTNASELLNCVDWQKVYLLVKDDSNNYCVKSLQECSERKLRDGLNIQKLYLSGVFGNVYISEKLTIF